MQTMEVFALIHNNNYRFTDDVNIRICWYGALKYFCI